MIYQPFSIGNVGIIPIYGTLQERVKESIIFFQENNSTSYFLIRKTLRAWNEKGSNIKQILLLVNSSGGYLEGLDSTLDVLASSRIPIKSVVTSMCASAAYAIAMYGNPFLALNENCEIGSIGVYSGGYLPYDGDKIDSYGHFNSFRGKDSPLKNDFSSEEWKQSIQNNMDVMTSNFIRRVSKARGETYEYVKNNFGKGGMLMALKAKDNNMIDRVMTSNQSNNLMTLLDNLDYEDDRKEPNRMQEEKTETKTAKEEGVLNEKLSKQISSEATTKKQSIEQNTIQQSDKKNENTLSEDQKSEWFSYYPFAKEMVNQGIGQNIKITEDIRKTLENMKGNFLQKEAKNVLQEMKPVEGLPNSTTQEANNLEFKNNLNRLFSKGGKNND